MSTTQFNAENCDILTRLMFEDWATVPMIRIVKLLLVVKGKVYNFRNIATMIDCGKSTAHRAIQTLIEKDYLQELDGDYRLVLGAVSKMGQDSEAVPETGQPVPLSGQSVPLAGQPVPETGLNNIKQITKKNNREDAAPPPHLKKQKTELVQRAEHVWLTDSQVEKLLDAFKNDVEYKFWVYELNSCFTNKPKQYKTYSDHYLTILSWRRMKLEKGLSFAKHPENGWGYYRDYVIKNFSEAA